MTSRLQRINGNDLIGREIKPSELLGSSISDLNREKVDKMRIKVLHKLIVLLIAMLLAIGGFIFLALFGELNPESSFIEISFVVLLGAVTVIWAAVEAISTIKRIKLVLNYNYERLQYGLIHTKYIKGELNDTTKTNHYYANVVFEENQTYIKKVIFLSSRDYEVSNSCDKVLVVSYDGIEAYIINTIL